MNLASSTGDLCSAGNAVNVTELPAQGRRLKVCYIHILTCS